MGLEGCKLLPVNKLRYVLFIGGFSLSVYQTYSLLYGFITQPTISTANPIQNASISRPDVVICKNVYGEALASGIVRSNDVQLIRKFAVMEKNFVPFLRVSRHMLFDTPIESSKINEMSKVIQNLGVKYLNCSEILGNCNVLFDGTAVAPVDCCKHSVMVLTERSICYRTSLLEPQYLSGKLNAAIYEVRFNRSTWKKEYSVNVVDQKAPNSTQLLGVNIEPLVEVDIAVKRIETLSINYTSKCATDYHRLPHFCRYKMRLQLIVKACQCNPKIPVTMSTPVMRLCKPFESNRCFGRQMRNTTFSQELDQISKICRMYSKLCTRVKYSRQTTQLKLDNTNIYLDQTEPHNVMISTLYVYHRSMTISRDIEALSQTWLSVASSLGGVWSLWLGWSLYGVAKSIYTFILHQFRSLRSTQNLEMVVQ